MDYTSSKSLILCCRLSINNSHSGRARTNYKIAQAIEINVDIGDQQHFFKLNFRPVWQLLMDVIQVIRRKVFVIIPNGFNRITHEFSYFLD